MKRITTIVKTATTRTRLRRSLATSRSRVYRTQIQTARCAVRVQAAARPTRTERSSAPPTVPQLWPCQSKVRDQGEPGPRGNRELQYSNRNRNQPGGKLTQAKLTREAKNRREKLRQAEQHTLTLAHSGAFCPRRCIGARLTCSACTCSRLGGTRTSSVQHRHARSSASDPE